MTHEERVRHHMYETLEGIAEQSERIASLEELVLDMYGNYQVGWNEEIEDELYDRMRELGGAE